jgi:hypothetical protein
MKTTERTMQWLKSCGIPRCKLEHRVPGIDPDTKKPVWFMGKTKDAWGCVDIEALGGWHPWLREYGDRPTVWWIQACSSGELATHIEKACLTENFVDLLLRGRFMIFAWRKLKGRGRRKWWPRVIELFFDGQIRVQEWTFEQVEGMLRCNEAPTQIAKPKEA